MIKTLKELVIFVAMFRSSMRFITVILFLLLARPAVAQQLYSKTELEAKRKEILDAIDETQKQLEATKKNKNATMGQLRALQNKLAERQHLIANINEELDDIDNNIKSSSNEVVQLKETLEQLKIRYAQSIRYAYQTRSSYDMLAFIFSADDYNDAIRRMKYLKKFREYREQQVEQIHITQGQIQGKIKILNVVKEQKDQLLNTQLQQKQVLQKETDETNQVVKTLKGREKELVAEIEKNKKIVARVNKAIDQVIEREIEQAQKKAEAEAKKQAAAEAKELNKKTTVVKVTTEKANGKAVAVNNPPSIKKTKVDNTTSLLLTPSDMALSNNFEGNKGKLPWPVERGLITDHFGTHPHPVAEKVMIENNGVTIRTAPNANVRASFEGTVKSVFTIAGAGWIVMIQHGKYFTVYNGLSNVSVKKDQHVDTKQSIGMAGNNDEGEPEVNFQIWKADYKNKRVVNVKLNPETWIAHLSGK